MHDSEIKKRNKNSLLTLHRGNKLNASVMPECFCRASICLKKYGFPPKTCGNDRFDPPCERIRQFNTNLLKFK